MKTYTFPRNSTDVRGHLRKVSFGPYEVYLVYFRRFRPFLTRSRTIDGTHTMAFRAHYSSIQNALVYVALLVFLTVCIGGVTSLVGAPRFEEHPHPAGGNEADSSKEDQKQRGCVYLSDLKIRPYPLGLLICT